MGSGTSRFVEIHISNQTENITLDEPRTFFYSGRTINSSEPSLPPGSSGTYKFSNNSKFYGCTGILAFNSRSFTFAIYFSNPKDYNRFSVAVALELSLDKVHKTDLEAAYRRLLGVTYSPGTQPMFPVAFLKEHQDRIQLTAGPIKVTAMVSRGCTTIVRMVVEEQEEYPETPENPAGHPEKHL